MVVSGLILPAGGAAMASHEAASHESTLDMTDVMDISCDPPGPSPGRSASSTASSRPASHVGEEIQAVSTRLYQVPVTPSSSARASPHIQRSPSLEDNRALTSSAEELSTTLGSGIRAAEPPDTVWVPIEKPEMKYSKYNSDFVEIDVPAPLPARRAYSGRESPGEKNISCSRNYSTSSTPKQISSYQEEVPLLQERPRVPDNDSDKSSKDSTSQSCDVRTSVLSLSFREHHEQSPRPMPFARHDTSFVSEKEHEFKEETAHSRTQGNESAYAWRRYTSESTLPEISQSLTQEESYPPLEKAAASVKDFTEVSSRTRGVKGSPSTTTSEDDLWLATEKKDQKKKKKKRSKISSQEEEGSSNQGMKSSTQETPKTKDSDEKELVVKEDKSLNTKNSSIIDAPLDIDIDADYFHAAQEYHEPSSNTQKSDFLKEFVEPQVEDFQEAQESVVQTLEDFELHGEDDDKEVPTKHSEEVMLKSLHDENDLARALEEAYSSDDNVSTQNRTQMRTRSRSRSARTSEMFPFKDETSDEEEEVRLRRRLVVSATITVSGNRSSANEETSTDDRGETSGDDRAESSTEDRRTCTSESDVAASPNPRANSSSKNKKKKKKKR